jgi:hypothetical protein
MTEKIAEKHEERRRRRSMFVSSFLQCYTHARNAGDFGSKRTVNSFSLSSRHFSLISFIFVSVLLLCHGRYRHFVCRFRSGRPQNILRKTITFGLEIKWKNYNYFFINDQVSLFLSVPSFRGGLNYRAISDNHTPAFVCPNVSTLFSHGIQEEARKSIWSERGSSLVFEQIKSEMAGLGGILSIFFRSTSKIIAWREIPPGKVSAQTKCQYNHKLEVLGKIRICLMKHCPRV